MPSSSPLAGVTPATTESRGGGGDISGTFVVAVMTCGRIAPSFGPAVGGFVRRYAELLGDAFDSNAFRLIAYRHGFRGILCGDVVPLGRLELDAAEVFSLQGGSPIGASRTRLSNTAHLRMRGLIKTDADDPYECAAAQIMKDRVRVLHVVGSADAHITAQRLSSLLSTKYHYVLHTVGFAKTIENDMYPIRMTLGAQTAAEEGAEFFDHVVAEHNSNPRMLIVHEIKGRAAGWLAAATAREYRRLLATKKFPASFGEGREVYDIDALYTPEMVVDFDAEIPRLRRCMDRHDTVSIFIAQGTMLKLIEKEYQEEGKCPERHPILGYPMFDTAGWLAAKIRRGVGAEKVLIQRSGVYVRAAPAGPRDRTLVQSCVHYAVDAVVNLVLLATNWRSAAGGAHPTSIVTPLRGVVGHDDRFDGALRLVEVEPLLKKRPFDLSTPWFVELLAAIGQPQEPFGRVRHRMAMLEGTKKEKRDAEEEKRRRGQKSDGSGAQSVPSKL